MKTNMEALKALELKLAEYSKENRAIATHESANSNGYGTPSCNGCNGSCFFGCSGSCHVGCVNGDYGNPQK